MAPGRPEIPIVVFPANNVVRCTTRPSAAVEGAMKATIDALTRLHTELMRPEGAGDGITAAFDAAVEQADQLATEAMVAPMDTAALKPIVPNHDYFGIRTAPLDDAYLVSEITTIAARALADLQHSRVALPDQAAAVLATIHLFRGLNPPDAAPAAEPADRPAGLVPYKPGSDELTRWITIHQYHFILDLAAAGAVTRALDAVRDGDRVTACDAFREAAVFVLGFTAAMMHSGDMSAPCYGGTVRPTMQPPAVPAALTGRTLPEHKAHRKAMRRVVREFPTPFTELAETDAELALARDLLLEADLIDIERHVIVAANLVGQDHSIIRVDPGAESATAVLRMMRHTRAVDYRPLMRYGDPIALVGGQR
ncbi:hypothetical protein ODJ79_27245 [Actinoplanes sp. KI2]|uniref:hypothetical protein n=1 Tax=Actinoplanes sp. KI2 TaxID=2983315 RepID=UPI0021D5EF76|nr:hypothetical protein [Actinoplanes sp. KI2]MCU7727445.1 hypothetical protein [Actinoplanes sp. KI2]